MSSKPEVSIHLIVRNGEKYLRHCLEAVKAQTYENIKFRVFNNASDDDTIGILREVWPQAELINFKKNYVLGGGFNRSLYFSDSPYVVGLSVDVLIQPDFIERAVEVMEKNKKIGVLQAKILRWDPAPVCEQCLADTKPKNKVHKRCGASFENDIKTTAPVPSWREGAGQANIIDTTGMQIFRSRRIINRGHGENDVGQYDKSEEIFCYEGAVPFFRRKALEDVKIKRQVPFFAPYAHLTNSTEVDKEDLQKYPYEYLDEDFVWYADEVDLGWRMRLLGWKNWYEPSVVAYHDRQTTHKLSGGYRGFIKLRKNIPAFKRKLDFQNQRLAFIKNDFWVSILKDFLWFLKRELFLFVYFLIWEQSTLPAYWKIIRLTPKMLKKRKEVMKKRKIFKEEMRKWFK